MLTAALCHTECSSILSMEVVESPSLEVFKKYVDVAFWDMV